MSIYQAIPKTIDDWSNPNHTQMNAWLSLEGIRLYMHHLDLEDLGVW